MGSQKKGSRYSQYDSEDLPARRKLFCHKAGHDHDENRTKILQNGGGPCIGMGNSRHIAVLAEHQAEDGENEKLPPVPFILHDFFHLFTLLYKGQDQQDDAGANHARDRYPCGVQVFICKKILAAGAGKTPHGTARQRKENPAGCL